MYVLMRITYVHGSECLTLSPLILIPHSTARWDTSLFSDNSAESSSSRGPSGEIVGGLKYRVMF